MCDSILSPQMLILRESSLKKCLFLLKNGYLSALSDPMTDASDSTCLPENMRWKSGTLWWFHLGLTSAIIGPGSILGYTTRRRNRIRNRTRLLGVLDYDYENRFAVHEHENRSDGLLPICTLL